MKQEVKIDGKGLERAIENIERQILREIEKAEIGLITIEKNKLIRSDGVRHEVDIYVKVDLKIGTDLIYIFECKDYHQSKRSISKNDIIIFEEKVKVCNAQKGYFVGYKFGIDSKNQAAKNPRLELLNFNTDFDTIKRDLTVTGSYVLTSARSSILTYPYLEIKDDHSKFDLEIEGQREVKNIADRLHELIYCVANGKEPRVDSAEVTKIVDREFLQNYCIKFGNCKLNGQAMDQVLLTIQLEIELAESEVICAYDVSTKGKYIRQRTRGFLNQGYMTMEITSSEPGKYHMHILDI